MYSQRYPYFNRFTKSYNILQFVDLYDKDSFIREYILDNVFVCIFMYILFYFAIWYAHKVIKRVEKKNQEMLVTVEKNRSRIDGIIALKNKREEYEEIVIKAKGAQKVMTIQLVNEMKRLDGEVAATNTKLNELEKFLAKTIFSGKFGEIVLKDHQGNLRVWKPTVMKPLILRRTHSKILRYSSHHSRRRRRLSHHQGSLESLQDHPYHPRHLRKSDSSNIASAETSSTESSHQVSIPLGNYDVEPDERPLRSHSWCLSGKPSAFVSYKRPASVQHKNNKTFIIRRKTDTFDSSINY